MQDERLTFAPTVEALFTRGMGSSLPPEVKNALRTDGLDLDRPLLPAYPAGKVAEWIDVALPHAYPGTPRAAALRELGRESVTRYASTVIGRGLAAMLKLLGLRRLLERMSRAMRTGGNYLETKTTVYGSCDVELWINDVNGMPEYFVGVLEGAAEILGIRDAQVEQLPTAAPGCTLRIRWKE